MLTPLIQIILASLLLMMASFSGVLLLWKGTEGFIQKNLSLLVSFAAGVFMVVVVELGVETFEHANPSTGLIWTAVGALVILALFKLIPTFHHHHDEECDDHEHARIDARRIIIGDALHNIGDGILLTTSFIVAPALGIATAISIFVHEFVQEASEFFVLRQAGFSVRRALWVNFIASSTVLLGSLGSYFLLDNFTHLETPLLGITAGSFLVVVLYDLIPHSVRSSRRSKSYAKYLGWFLAGILVMLAVNTIASHAHIESDDAHIHEEELVNH